jgi:hypothetical protein
VRRPCLVCGTLTDKSRCPEHRAQQRAKYGGAWRSIARTAVRAHVALHGWWCPGHRRPPHESEDLTLDHASNRVLCRSCNTRSRNFGDG